MHNADLISSLWAATFDKTYLVTIDGNERRVNRFLETLPFDPGLVTVDRTAAGYDCSTGAIEPNHHVVVGNRHKRILADAARRELNSVFVFEDDAEFTVDATARLPRVLRWAADHKGDWDIFYMGFLAPVFSSCSYVTRSVVRPRRPFHAHAIGYSRRVYNDILAIDFSGDHRPRIFRAMERLTSPSGRQDPYFRDGVGSLDSWLSFSTTRRLAASPILVVQTSLPPGTESNWRRLTGRDYDAHQTPRTLAAIALTFYYLRAALLIVAVLVLALLVARC